MNLKLSRILRMHNKTSLDCSYRVNILALSGRLMIFFFILHINNLANLFISRGAQLEKFPVIKATRFELQKFLIDP